MEEEKENKLELNENDYDKLFKFFRKVGFLLNYTRNTNWFKLEIEDYGHKEGEAYTLRYTSCNKEFKDVVYLQRDLENIDECLSELRGIIIQAKTIANSFDKESIDKMLKHYDNVI